jgi:hypothetical protein
LGSLGLVAALSWGRTAAQQTSSSESMGKMSKKAKIARFAGCEHNRDAVMAGP